MGLRSIIEKRIRRSRLTPIDKELERISAYDRYVPGIANVFDRPFKFHDGESFVVTYNEIFVNKLYDFNPTVGKSIILDCGANMGLGTLYFGLNFPNHQVLAFEPDQEIYEVLAENIATFDLKNVKLYNEAVWNCEEVLEFYTDKGMGGRVISTYVEQQPTRVQTVRLLDFLSNEVDFLKIDIEGAEDVVLRDCEEKLGQVGSLFFEYHNDVNKPQTLHELLEIIQRSGFHYYIKESGVRKSPFKDTHLICESFDMAINIFCYRDHR